MTRTHAVAALWIVLLAGSCSAGSGTSGPPQAGASDPWTSAQLMQPAGLDSILKTPGAAKPLLLHVGFQVLFRGGAIPGSRYLGPGSKPEGIASLLAAVKDEPRGRGIVLYCGCCPWDHCPNMRPAFKALRDAGFTNVRALYVPHNFQSDWAEKGYPVDAAMR